MAGVKISALPSVASALTTDIFPVVQGGVTSQETLAQVQTLFGFSGGILAMANGGTGAALVAANGAIPYSSATDIALLAAGASGQLFQSGGVGAPHWTTPTYPSASGTAGKILRSDGTNNVYSTSTFADTYAINTILYNASANTVSGLATLASAVLVTSAGGVPSLSQTLPSAVQTNITALGAQSQALNMNTHQINGVTDPSLAQDAATKNYVDTVAQGRQFKDPVQAASTTAFTVVYANGTAGVGATLTNNGAQAAFSTDGYSASVGDRILIKDQASTLQNGIYTVTTLGSGASNWVLTRSTDMDQPSEFKFATVFINNGTTQQGQTWTETATVVTVGTDAVTFVQTGDATGVTSVASGTGLTGGPITTTGTLSLASIAAHSLWANVTGGAAVPTVIGTNTFIQSVNVQVITATGTYTPTTGMTFCTVEIVGGGGGAGSVSGGTAGQAAAATGGGGGGYCKKTYTATLLGASAAVVIGAAGAAGASGNNNGTAGGNSTFTPAGAGVVLTANGGGAGNGAAKGAGGSTTSGVSGGSATNGDINIPGGSSGNGSVQAAAGFAASSSGGSSVLGSGGAGVILQTGAAFDGATGSGYGSGGSGAADTGARDAGGGNGKIGICYITEYIAV